MAAAVRDQWAETVVGAAVLAAAAGFLIYALGHTSGGGARGGYELIARFGEAGALAPGADVRVAGVKVGTVSNIELEPSFLARATLVVDPTVKLPADSTAKITSDGLLGGSHVSIAPGGATENMAAGAEFKNTQGAVDLFGLIGRVLRPTEPAASTAPPAEAPAAADPYPG
jgi:phospholipid/cholesterol/gamma-HCH transport system substrate-binding protein